MRATLYLISQSYVSGRKLCGVLDGLCAATNGHAEAVRLERDGAGMWHVLSRLAAGGATDITLRPVGSPFSQSLMSWLPNAAGEWLDRSENARVRLRLAEDTAQDNINIVHDINKLGITATSPNAKMKKQTVNPPFFVDKAQIRRKKHNLAYKKPYKLLFNTIINLASEINNCAGVIGPRLSWQS